MHKELLAQTPLLALPLVALVLFILVFVVESMRALRRPKAEVSRDAALPFSEDDHEGQ